MAPLTGSRSGSDHLRQPLEMVRVDEIDDSLGIAAYGPYIEHSARTVRNLNAFVFIGAKVEFVVADRTSQA
jgi:hypothetical protein